MEMTSRRWIAIAGVSCAALAALRLPPHAESRSARMIAEFELKESRAASGLLNRLTNLGDAATLISRRDTLVAAARANASRSGPLIVRTATLTDSESTTINEAIAAQAAAIGNGARMLVIGITSDTSTAITTRVNYGTDRQFLLPAAAGNEQCVTVLRIGRARRDLSPGARRGIFGPCAFHAAFGAPGPAVEKWLAARGYDVAFDAAWPERTGPDPSLLAIHRPDLTEDLQRWMNYSRWDWNLDITGCSSGDLEICAKAFRWSQHYRARKLPGVVFPINIAYRYESSLGRNGPAMLADLLAVHGRAKFEKFWKSPGDLEVAFTSAFGESTGEWTMRWMQYRYGRDTRGPYIAPRSALLSITTSLALVAICAAFAHRREAV